MKANIPALGLSVAVGLAACGGGELLAVLQIVTPLGGAWSNAGFTTTIQFTNLQPATQVFLSRFDVTATVNSTDGVCGDALNNGVNLSGTVDNGKFVLRPIAPAGAANCIEGTFTDLRRFEAVAVANQPREYTNSRVDIQLQIGLWVSENGALSLKFDPGFEAESVDNFPSTTPVTGCNVSNPQAKVNFVGEMLGFNAATLRRPWAELTRVLSSANTASVACTACCWALDSSTWSCISLSSMSESSPKSIPVSSAGRALALEGPSAKISSKAME